MNRTKYGVLWALLILIGAGELFFVMEGRSAIVLTSPTQDVQIAEGYEYAAHVAGNPMNMDRLRDIGFDYGLYEPSATGGIWSARSKDATAYLFPVYQGIPDTPYMPYFYYYTEGTPLGAKVPINANRFTHFSIRMAMNQSARSWMFFWWATNINANVGNNLIGRYDGDLSLNNAGGYAYVPTPSSFRIYDIDLRGEEQNREKHPTFPDLYSPAGIKWTGTVYGLQFQPSSAMPMGTDFYVDWIRIYDPSLSPNLEITWNSDYGNGPEDCVQLFIDQDNTGYDGDLFASGLRDDGSYQLRTGALPPGDYYLYLKAVRNENSGFTVLATSQYSARIRIGQSPTLQFSAPSFTSGEDYATKQLGNPWDFNSADDIYQFAEISGQQYTGGVMAATANAPLPGQRAADPRIQMNTRKNGVIIPINTSRYRYFTYRYNSDIYGTSNIQTRVTQMGWEVKLLWWNSGLSLDGTYSCSLPILENWHSYTVDLWDDTIINQRYVGIWPQKGWRGIPQVTMFRFDTHENQTPVRFWLDDMKLTAMNEPSNNHYLVSWNIEDSDSTNVTVRLYSGYYSGSTYVEDALPLTVVTQAPGVGSYDWNMTGFPNDDYYLRAEITDGAFLNSVSSKVPIRVSTSWPRTKATWDDPTVYQSSAGNWKILYAGGGMTNVQWGFNGSVALSGDYDGDRKNDLAIFYNITGRWYIRTVEGQILAWNFNWGWPGATPVEGDYDGDGVSDLAVLDENTGRWYVYSLAKSQVLAWNVNWGWKGAKPVPGDYDGDGKSDFAVLDKNVGRWYIYSIAKSQVLAWNFNWGWKGCEFVPGDYDGDGASDLAVFDRNISNWFIYSIKKNQVLRWYYQWGFSGATPVSGDFDGDGITDLTVYYEPTGCWYFLFSRGGTDYPVLWGGPGWTPMGGNFDGR